MTHVPLSYWQQTADALLLTTDLPSAIDVAVIGAGLLGTSTCYWLVRQGVRVALLERHAPAAGATGRNGGFVVVGPAEPYFQVVTQLGQNAARAVMTITTESQQLLRQVMQEEALSCWYREPGTIRLALTEVQNVALRQDIAALQADGYAAQLLDRQQVQAFLSTPLGPEIVGGRLLPEQALVHSARLVQGLVRAAQRRGAQVCQTTVTALLSHGSHVEVQTTTGHLHVKAVVVAINAWTSLLLPELTDLIVPVREQMLAYAPIAPIFPVGLSATVTTDEYWQQTPDGTILIGGCGSIAPGEDIGVWESQPTAIVQAALEQVLPRLFPTLPPLHVVQRWAGLLGSTSDSHPIVDRVPDTPGVFVVGGFSGHGMPFGMRLGQLLAQAAVSGTLPDALHPFRLARPTLERWKRP